MGFYGNITNTSNTTFSFDRIYPNRLSMDANTNNDGIFIGRYVLVEYERKAAYPVVYTKVVEDNLQFYSSPNCEDITRIRFGTGSDQIDINDIVKSYPEGTNETTTDGGEWPIGTNNIKFYRCNGSVTINAISYATFIEITDKEDVFGQKSDYILNYAIDENHYYPQDENERRTYKGYDSTVWTKVSEISGDGKLITKYVNIADLNSVVPTFDIAADAPTMIPITPHFDADSTNVYYKLHIQPQWGMRVAAADSNEKSDIETYWTRENYDPSTGLSTKQYWNKNNGSWVNYTNEEDIQTFNAAIYYNKAGFEEYTRKHDDDVELNDNIINIEPTGESGNLYSNHNITNTKSVAKDIQEIRINLPAIGNMMSDAWDIIHGPDRDDARGDEKGSLQGRLDSFAKMEDNHIPIKRHDDGTLIGTAINGNQKYNFDGKNILTADNFPLTTNDPWIDVTIDNSSLQGGYDKKNETEISQENNNAIRIRHSANKVDPTITFWDKNGTEASINNSYNYYNIDTNINGEQDKIKLYVPYVDATGHVVGKNIETVTLPYSYKYFQTNGLSTEKGDIYSTNVKGDGTTETKTTEGVENNVEAHNTQDTLSINPANKWIQTKLVETTEGTDELTIAHEIHSIDVRDSDSGDNKTSHSNANKEEGATQEDNLTIYDWSYDEAGHITSKRKHTYTLPYGFKTINVGNDTTESAAPVQTNIAGETADSTQDSLTFTPTNKWIKTVATGNNEIKFGHELSSVVTTDKEATDLNATATKSDSIIIPDWSYDAAGHITSKQKHEYILPYGYKSFTDGTNTSTANSTQDEFNLVGDNWLQPIVANDTITYNHIGPVKPATVSDKDNIENPQFGSTFIIEDWHFDSKGHMHTSGKTHTVQFPKGSIEHPIATSNNSEIITSLSFVPESGKISYQKDNSSTLKLTIDYTNNGIGAGNIAGGDSLNTAFAKLEKQIMQEANTRATDILKEASDRDTAIKTAIADLVDNAPENINTLGEIVKWLDDDGDEKVDIIKDIAKNASDIGSEVSRATDAEGALQEKIDILQSWKDTATQDIADLNNIISQMQITIQDLQNQINELKNPPQEPDNGGENV